MQFWDIEAVAEPREKEWKVTQSSQLFICSSHFFGVVISKTAAAAEETIVWEDGDDDEADDENAPLKTPGWSHSDCGSHMEKLRRLDGCCGWSTCRTSFQRTAFSWIPGGEIPRPLLLPLDSLPSPHWRSHGTHPMTWKKNKRNNETDEEMWGHLGRDMTLEGKNLFA